MIAIEDLFSPEELGDELSAGYVRFRRHPNNNELVVFNYTEKASYERRWNHVTTVCRGLIVDTVEGTVLARPFHKFFNYNEPEAPDIDPQAIAYAHGNKEDGSLGIAFINPYTDKVEIATRGSFESEQAIYATNRLVTPSIDKAVRLNKKIDGVTTLFEIVYPGNRIVLDYGKREELIPLGYIDDETGGYMPAVRFLDGKSHTVGSIMADVHRKNAEGWVIWLDPQTAIKIKQEDYVALHRIVTGTNRKTIWEQLQKSPDEYDAFVAQLPDELYSWASEVREELLQEFSEISKLADSYYVGVLEYMDEHDQESQKDFALAVQKFVPKDYQSLVYGLRNGKDTDAMIWKRIQPVGGEM